MVNKGGRHKHCIYPFLDSFAVLCIIASLFTSPPTLAREPVLEKTAITLATRRDLPPYVMHKATHGIEIDLVKAIFAQTDIKIKFIQMPRVRMIQMFDDGRVDGLLTQNATASTEGCITDWYLSHQNLAFSVKGKSIKVDILADLINYSVLSFDGARKYLGPHFAKAVKDSTHYTETPDQSKHVELLYKNRFDLIVGEEWILRLGQQKTYARTGQYHELEAHNILPISLYSARFQNPEHCLAFNASLASLRSNGTYERILSEHHEKLRSK